jgi:hypothetical protein
MMPESTNVAKVKQAKKRMMNYYWHDQKLYFKGLCVPKLEEKKPMVVQMHEDLGYFNEQRILSKIYRCCY